MTAVVFTVAGGHGDVRLLDQLTGELADDLREIRSVSVGPVRFSGGAGAAHDAVPAIGQLAVSGAGLGAVVLMIRDIALRFLERTRADSITISNGERTVVIEPPSGDRVDDLIGRMRDLLRDG